MSDPATHAESRMLIDGELVPARDDRSYENLNPATEEVLGQGNPLELFRGGSQASEVTAP